MGAGRVAAVLAVVTAFLVGSASAAALDPADAITLSSVAPASGTSIYIGQPFAFSGDATVDGPDPISGAYSEQLLFAPRPSGSFSCPTDYNAAVQDLQTSYGPGALGQLSDTGVSVPPLPTGGPFTWSAQVNGGVVAQLTRPGSYVACAYLIDATTFGSPTAATFAVSGAVDFTVVNPPGSAPPGRFGGPPGHRGRPRDLGLRIAAQHSPIRAPGRNLLEISGQQDASTPADALIVTLKSTRRYDGCAPDDQQDVQITRADGGAVLARFQRVRPSAAGRFRSPLALNFRRRPTGSLVVCAYLTDTYGDVLVGFDRFTVPRPRSHRHHRDTGERDPSPRGGR